MAKPVYLLMRPEDNLAVKESLHIDAEDNFIKIISPEGYLGGVVEAMQVLKEGNIVSIMGDRKYGFEALEVSFLKNKAYFPFGAFSLAASNNCPVVVLLSAKLPGNKYIVDLAIRRLRFGRNTAIRSLVKGRLADITPEMITKAARGGDLPAKDIWREIGSHLGVTLSGVINLLNPEMVIIGGGISQAGKFLFGPLRETVKKLSLIHI